MQVLHHPRHQSLWWTYAALTLSWYDGPHKQFSLQFSNNRQRVLLSFGCSVLGLTMFIPCAGHATTGSQKRAAVAGQCFVPAPASSLPRRLLRQPVLVVQLEGARMCGIFAPGRTFTGSDTRTYQVRMPAGKSATSRVLLLAACVAAKRSPPPP